MSWNDEPAGGALRMYHIPGCPFSERVELLLDLKGLHDIMADHEIDISKPRPDWLLRKTRGTTSLPALETPMSMRSRRCCARPTASSPARAIA